MSNTLKNLLLLLGVATIGYGAYYLYVVRSDTTLGTDTTDIEYQTMITRTQSFIQIRQELDQMPLDLSLFENPQFRTLQSYSKPLKEVEAGRSNPFSEVGNTGS